MKLNVFSWFSFFGRVAFYMNVDLIFNSSKNVSFHTSVGKLSMKFHLKNQKVAFQYLIEKYSIIFYLQLGQKICWNRFSSIHSILNISGTSEIFLINKKRLIQLFHFFLSTIFT